MTGTWQIIWDKLPPTLVMTCTVSNDQREVGKTIEAKLMKLDNATFSYMFQRSDSATTYERAKWSVS